jgi:ElaB/YqjD/DUF883 family membrane-anchored ribosome-binding protein
MNEIRTRWIAAGEQFATLGSKFQDRYTGRTGDEVDGRLHAAIEQAMHAVEEVLISAGHALEDQMELREDAQRALAALQGALAVTFTDATDEIEAAAGRLRLGLAELGNFQNVVDR